MKKKPVPYRFFEGSIRRYVLVYTYMCEGASAGFILLLILIYYYIGTRVYRPHVLVAIGVKCTAQLVNVFWTQVLFSSVIIIILCACVCILYFKISLDETNIHRISSRRKHHIHTLTIVVLAYYYREFSFTSHYRRKLGPTTTYTQRTSHLSISYYARV